ncbi:MAG: hypothetical protein QW561_03270 [Candidatus Aenigmatarchaeota archaeon]
MILKVYRDPKFVEAIDTLHNQGGKSLAIAKKADRLINRILKRRVNGFPEVGKLTNKGELRIKHCKKYDLGDGYRLITLEEGNQIVFLYIGSHDQCSRWLERNKGLQYKIDEIKDVEVKTIETKEDEDEFMINDYIKEKIFVDEYEEQLMARIDDKILRKIFWGLCR